jgi:hypothetical protein
MASRVVRTFEFENEPTLRLIFGIASDLGCQLPLDVEAFDNLAECDDPTLAFSSAHWLRSQQPADMLRSFCLREGTFLRHGNLLKWRRAPVS